MLTGYNVMLGNKVSAKTYETSEFRGTHSKSNVTEISQDPTTKNG